MSTATLNGAPPAANASPFAGHATESGGGSYDLCPAGNHPAHLVAIYDLGTHDEEYQGEPKLNQRKLYLAWELSGEFKPDGDPFVIGKDYTVLVADDGSFEFAERSNLRLMLEGWRGKKFEPGEPIDPGAALGKSCLVNVSHTQKKEKTYHNLDKVSGLPRAMAASMPARVHDLVAYHISMGEPPVVEWLPRVYYRPKGSMEALDVVARVSKEFTGEPIGKAGKGKDTPYSTSAPKAPTATGPVDEDIPF